MLWLLVSSDRKWTLCVCQCLSVCFYGFSSRHVVQSGSFRFFFHHIFSPGVLTGLLVCFGARRNKSCLFEEFEKARGLLMKQKHPEVCWKVKGSWMCLSAQDTRCQLRKSAISGQGDVRLFEKGQLLQSSENITDQEKELASRSFNKKTFHSHINIYTHY